MKRTIIVFLLALLSISHFSQDISAIWDGIKETRQSELIIYSFNVGKIREIYTKVINMTATRILDLKPLVDVPKTDFKYEVK